MSGNGFLKLVRGEKTLELFRYPNCLTLLTVIAYRASRNGNGLSMRPGEALIGDYENYGLSEQQYRTAKERLSNWNLATFKATNKGTIATLTDSSIYDINQKPDNEQNPITATDEQRTSNEQTTTNKKDKNIKNERIKELTAAFEEFWKYFPKKIKKDKAEKKFKLLKLTGEELEKLIAAVKVLATQATDGKFAGEKGQLQYCTNPVTWLDEKRWNDEPEKISTGSTGLNELTHPATEAEIAALEAAGLLSDKKPQAAHCFMCDKPAVFKAGIHQLCEEHRQAYDLISRQQKHRNNLKITPKQYLPAGQLESLILEYKAKTNFAC